MTFFILFILGLTISYCEEGQWYQKTLNNSQLLHRVKTHEGVLLKAYNFFGKNSVKEAFLGILKNILEEISFGISLDAYSEYT